ncbi:hypothetical protein KY321_03350 [Candidatus Woesearchaeota archaeon]|nr:hypothetical protein [Candidatus Woesearchaeota archaeon]
MKFRKKHYLILTLVVFSLVALLNTMTFAKIFDQGNGLIATIDDSYLGPNEMFSISISGADPNPTWVYDPQPGGCAVHDSETTTSITFTTSGSYEGTCLINIDDDESFNFVPVDIEIVNPDSYIASTEDLAYDPVDPTEFP